MKYTVEQLHLLIHNCNVYGLGNDVKEQYENGSDDGSYKGR